MLPRDDLGDDHPLALALVREHRRAGDVTDRVDPLRRRLHPLVDLDEAAVGELHAGFLEANVLGVRRTSRGHEHAVDDADPASLHQPRATASRNPCRPSRPSELRAGDDVDPALLEAAGDLGGRILVLERQDPREHLEDRHLRAERVKHVGEFAADGAGADDRDGLRRLGENERLVRRDDRRLVELESRPAAARARASRSR